MSIVVQAFAGPELTWPLTVIEGARVDNLHYLAEHGIDRNRVAQELSHIFSRMIYVTGEGPPESVVALSLTLPCAQAGFTVIHM